MKKHALFMVSILAVGLIVSACNSGGNSGGNTQDEAANISGRIEGGLRVLTFDPTQKEQNFKIYRGDYVQPEVKGGGSLHLVSPDLEVDGQYPPSEGDKVYFKVPKAGSYPYQAGDLSGVIEAVEYTAATYREVGAQEAFELIANIDPVILDVRSAGEYESGHIAGSILIPVQVLQKRIAELDQHKEKPIFVYCKSGNRSTVASRLLIDRGFMQVINLRKGINDWRHSGYPLAK
jgi:rhodanese-related sulfurtransferase